MTDIRESPSGPLVNVGGPEFMTLGRITIPAFTAILGGALLEQTFGIAPFVSDEETRKWRVMATLIPNAAGVTAELSTGLSFQPTAVQIGLGGVEARIAIRNEGVDPADTGEDDLVFGIAAFYFSGA
jgi:hypothetical protein